MQPDTDIQQLRKRFTESGTPNTTANYDQAYKRFRSENTFQNTSATNQDNFGQYDSLGTGTGELYNEQFYIFNANNSSEYTFATWEATFFGNLRCFLIFASSGNNLCRYLQCFRYLC